MGEKILFTEEERRASEDAEKNKKYERLKRRAERAIARSRERRKPFQRLKRIGQGMVESGRKKVEGYYQTKAERRKIYEQSYQDAYKSQLRNVARKKARQDVFRSYGLSRDRRGKRSRLSNNPLLDLTGLNFGYNQSRKKKKNKSNFSLLDW